MADCIEDPNDPCPQTSEWLPIGSLLPDECNKTEDKIIIETNLRTVEGVVDSIKCNSIKVRYKATDAGYTPCYILQPCDIQSVRCYSCCDDRFFPIPDCDSLTPETIDAVLGADFDPVGDIYLYAGDIAQPDCKWKYSGFGDLYDPSNWYNAQSNLSAQFDQMSSGDLVVFLNWLTSIFEGNGVSFNVNAAGDQIVVTAGGGGGGGASSSFTFSYSGGTITHDPNDGSGPNTLDLIKREPNAPSAPYDWFFFINENSNGLFINNNGNATLLGFLDEEQASTCEDVVDCITSNINNSPQPTDEWAMPWIVGPDWVIDHIDYDGDQTADFSGCGGTDLTTLVIALNSCPNLPFGWSWINKGGVLTLCTPPHTSIDEVVNCDFSGPEPVCFSNHFPDGPTLPGNGQSDLCFDLAECITSRDLIPAMRIGSSTNEADIENDFQSFAAITVRWKDSDGDQRVSYKDPVNGWYHPVYKSRNVAVSSSRVFNDSIVTPPDVDTEEILFNFRTMPDPIPDDAKHIYLSTRAYSRVQKKDSLATTESKPLSAFAAVALSPSLIATNPVAWAQCASSSFLPGALNGDPVEYPWLLTGDLNSSLIKLAIGPSAATLRANTYVRAASADLIRPQYTGSDQFFVESLAQVRIVGWSR